MAGGPINVTCPKCGKITDEKLYQSVSDKSPAFDIEMVCRECAKKNKEFREEQGWD